MELFSAQHFVIIYFLFIPLYITINYGKDFLFNPIMMYLYFLDWRLTEIEINFYNKSYNTNSILFFGLVPLIPLQYNAHYVPIPCDEPNKLAGLRKNREPTVLSLAQNLHDGLQVLHLPNNKDFISPGSPPPYSTMIICFQVLYLHLSKKLYLSFHYVWGAGRSRIRSVFRGGGG